MKKTTALLIFAFALTAASLGAVSAAAPIILSAALLAAVNALMSAVGLGASPMAWNLYTALCGFRGALMLGSASLMRDGMGTLLGSLGKEYVVCSLVILISHAALVYRRQSARRARRNRAGA